MPTMRVDYASSSEDTDRGRSPGLWRGSYYDEIITGNNTKGLHTGDDFTGPTISGDNYTLLEADSNAAWAGVEDISDGRIKLTLSTSDDEEGNLIWGDAEKIICNIAENSGIAVFFEARWKVSSVSDNVIAAYVGLMEPAMAGADIQTDDSGVLAIKDWIVHRNVFTNGGTTGTETGLDAAFATTSGAEVEVVSDAATLEADTFIKTGFTFDGRSEIKYFVNGLPNATTSDPTDTNFPDTEGLTFGCGAKLGETTGGIFTLDWWHVIVLNKWANS